MKATYHLVDRENVAESPDSRQSDTDGHDDRLRLARELAVVIYPSMITVNHLFEEKRQISVYPSWERRHAIPYKNAISQASSSVGAKFTQRRLILAIYSKINSSSRKR